MIRHPKVRSPILINSAIALIDLVPTVQQMLGIETQHVSEGIGLVDYIAGRDQFPKRLFFGVDRESQYVRRGHMKLIAWADRSLELYDLANDPGEKTNLKDLQPNLAVELEELLAEHEMLSLDQALKLLLTDKRLGIWRGNGD
jgi:arylsulfatase A-like enzyme